MKEKNIEPIRPLVLLFAVACLSLLLMIFSVTELPITDDFSLRIFSFDDFMNRAKVQTVDIGFVKEMEEKIDSLENVSIIENVEILPKKDTTKANTNSSTNAEKTEISKKAIAEKAEKMDNIRREIELPDEKLDALFNFFQSIENIAVEGGLTRIVHYGDSQIEGDRISKYLRRRLQNRFGGCGVGMVPMQERANMRATLQTSGAANWKKYGYADSKRRPKHNKLGLLNSYYTFENEESSDSRAWVKFSSSSMDGAKSTKIENIKVLYRSPNAEMKINITQNGKKDSTIFNEELAQTENFEMLEKEYRASFKAITFRFESSGNAEVLGVCFDCNDGIAVDNVPLRGSSGLDFTKMNKDYLREQIKQMNVRLMILQFGVNIVPYVLNDYSFYEKQLLSQLKYLKSISPDLDILVVGVSDMSRSRSGSYESYPNVVKIRNAQKNAAFKAGCAFWDLYEAMGGENSMISWVRNRPSLASPDYIHFNDKGATFVGEMLYDALMKSYDDYKLAQ